MKRQVRVDLGELAIALDTASSELHQYLDLETGQIIPIMEEIAWELEQIYEELYDEVGDQVATLENYLQQRDDPGWQKEMMLEADRIEREYGTRYVRVERDDPYGDYRDMERFIGTIEDGRLRERLGDAIQGRGAFRRFKDLLARHPQVEEAWFEFKDVRLQKRVADWLEFHDIEPLQKAHVKVGDSIVTQPGIIDPDLGLDISGWQGRVIEMSTGLRGQDVTCIEWDGPTLKQMPREIIEKCEEDGLDWRVMWLDAVEVELMK